MQKKPFTLNAEISFLTRFDLPKKWWQWDMTHQMKFPEIAEKDLTNFGSIQTEVGYQHRIGLSVDYLKSSAGQIFLTAYCEALKNLTPQLIPTNFGKPTDFFSYTINLEIENTSSHMNPVILDTYEVNSGHERLMRTARDLKQIARKQIISDQLTSDQLTSNQQTLKSLVLNSEETTENKYLELADFWAANADAMELHYYDLDAETDAAADQLHKAFLDSKLFVEQFNRLANDIDNMMTKMNRARDMATQKLA